MSEERHYELGRRSMDQEMYKTVCEGRFTSLKEDIDKVADDTQYLRRKVDNGLSSLPTDVAELRKSLKNVVILGVLPALLAFFAGAGFWLYSFGKMEATLDMHIKTSEAMIAQVLAEVEGENDGIQSSK